MKKLNISIIGVGHLGKIHTKLWAQNAAVNLVGVFDINQQKAKEVAAEFGCRAFGSLRELIQSTDAVTIASDTKSHFKLAKKMLENKIHCLIEKPITATYAESKKLIKIAEENKSLVQVGHVERFNPALVAVKKYDLDPLFIEAHRLSQFRPRAIDVSVVHDLMIHDIDIILWLIKSPVKRIDANGVAILTNTPDIANARIEFKNGAIANITASRISANSLRKFRIFQRDAYFSIDFANQKVDMFKILDGKLDPNKYPLAFNLGSILDIPEPKSIVYEQPEIPKLNAIEEEQNSFVESILASKPIAVTAYEAMNAVRIAEIITRQIEKNLKKLKKQILIDN